MHHALLLRSIATEDVAHIQSHTLLIYVVRACAYAREYSDDRYKVNISYLRILLQ